MAALRTSPPPPQADELHRWTLDSADGLRGLRAAIYQALTGETLTDGRHLDEIPELVVLVATELATNALRHGIPPTIVRLLADDGYFYLDVADHDLTSVPELCDAHPAGAGGRGLQLAQSFSLTVGWYATADTKNIWASFPRR